jgi:hypothetical protein
MRPFKKGESLYNVIQTAIPDFVEADYPLFMEFVSAFARFLESGRTFANTSVSPDYGSVGVVQNTVTAGGPAYEARKLLEYRDIASTLDEFVSHFLSMYGKSFPRHTHIPADLLVQTLRNFYRAKGTPESIEWFFRAVFDEDASIYFPREDILRTSDGTWEAPVTIKVSSPIQNPTTHVTPPNSHVATFYIGQRIESATGSAQVENVTTTVVGQAYNQQIIVNELTLKADTIVGTFQPTQVITNIDTSEQVYTTILPVISDVIVASGGSNYAANDIVLFSEGPAGGYGYGAAGVVALVASTALNGVGVIDGGDGYVTGLPVQFTSTTGHGATGVVEEVVYGELKLEDGSGYLQLEDSSTGPSHFVLEDKNTILLDLLITPFLTTQNTITRDSSGNSRDGAYVNGTLLNNSAPAIVGSDYPFFDGVDDSITVPQNNALSGFVNFAIEFWVNGQNTTSTFQEVLGNPNTGFVRSWEIYYHGTTGRAEALLNGVTIGQTPAASVATNTWNHVVLSRTGTAVTWYVNGSPVANATFANTLNTTNSALLMGRFSGSGTFPYKGYMDDVAIYNHDLSSANVASHYACRTSQFLYQYRVLQDTPVAYYKFADIGVYLDANDYSIPSGTPSLSGLVIDSAIEIILAAGSEKPFMHPWVFTDAIHTAAELANAAAILTLTCNVASFANGVKAFTLTTPQDTTTNVTTAAVSANVIISDTSDAGKNTLYLKQFANLSSFATGQTWKQSGTGITQQGTVTTDGSATVLGSNTKFTLLTANSHLRFADGSQHVVRAVTNNTLLTTFAPTSVTLVANTWSIVPVGKVQSITLQAQRYYGKIKEVQLLTSGEGYKTPPAVSSYSMSADAQHLFYLEPDLSGNVANGTVTASSGRINVWRAATLQALQDAGQVVRIKILSSGANYLDANSIQITALHTEHGSGKDAQFTAVLGAITKYPGQYTTSRGWLSADKYLQDADLYNNFTYVVRTAESFDRYKDLLLTLMHPAGFKALGEFVRVEEANLTNSANSTITIS